MRLLPLEDIAGSFLYGLRLDLSIASYITILPAVFLSFLPLFRLKTETIQRILLLYTIFWLSILSLIYTVDAELFSFWGFRLDNTLFRYAATAGEMIGSTLSSPLYILIPFLFIYGWLFYKIYVRFIRISGFQSFSVLQSVTGICMGAVLVLAIRGGVQQIPVNESVAYYSSHPILNQAALNPVWTLGRSVIEQNGPDMNRYVFFPSEADAASILKEKPDTVTYTPLTNNRPNIILIVWESLTEGIVNDSVTPGLYALSKEGIYFTNLYASGDRSDKGLTALLSGYPSQPDYSIMTEPGKSRKLPFITQQLKKAGYHTGYIYGGELEFANMRSYMNYNGFDEILGKKDFPKESWGAKWGAHDETTYKKLLELASKQTDPSAPFFYTLFTLSSHEPFDFPAAPAFPGTSKPIQFMNAHHYADSCLYDFIQKAKKQPWWANTWVIIVADHGHVLPLHDYASHDASEFHIPMVWLGGALKDDSMTIQNTYSQIHLAPSIAAYLLLNPAAFTFSGPIQPSGPNTHHAWYSYNDGFGTVRNDSTYTLFDLNNQQVSVQKGPENTAELTRAKAFLQILMEDFNRK